MAYTLVTVPIIDPDFRTEDNWDRMDIESFDNSYLFGELCAEFDGVKGFSLNRNVHTKLETKAFLPSGKKLEAASNISVRKGLAAFLDASEAKEFVRAYLERSKGICIPEVTQVYEDFDPQEWTLS